MRKMLDIADSIEKIPQFFGRLGSWLILPLIAIIMFDVLTRKLFGGGIQQYIQEVPSLYEYLSPTKLQEWEWHPHGAMFMLAAAILRMIPVSAEMTTGLKTVSIDARWSVSVVARQRTPTVALVQPPSCSSERELSPVFSCGFCAVVASVFESVWFCSDSV